MNPSTDECLLCVAAHQPAVVQAAEALAAAYQSTSPAAETDSITEAKRSAPLSKTSTWTGLVNLDKAGVHSIAAITNSSEISEEHVVIHLRSKESWDDKQDELKTSEHDQDDKMSSDTLGLPDLRSLESNGGSAHEEEDGGFLELSDTPTLASVTSSTSPPQTSNSVLAEFVHTLMRPFRYWTGGEEVKTERGLSVPDVKESENQTQGETFSGNLSLPKASEKGSVHNAITEPRSGVHSSGDAAAGIQSVQEGLSEQEREVTPLIRLVPAVQHAGQSVDGGEQREPATSTSAETPPSTVNGTSTFSSTPLTFLGASVCFGFTLTLSKQQQDV